MYHQTNPVDPEMSLGTVKLPSDGTTASSKRISSVLWPVVIIALCKAINIIVTTPFGTETEASMLKNMKNIQFELALLSMQHISKYKK